MRSQLISSSSFRFLYHFHFIHCVMCWLCLTVYYYYINRITKAWAERKDTIKHILSSFSIFLVFSLFSFTHFYLFHSPSFFHFISFRFLIWTPSNGDETKKKTNDRKMYGKLFASLRAGNCFSCLCGITKVDSRSYIVF